MANAKMFDDMALTVAADKENVAPTTSSDPLQRKSPRKGSRKGRSKSIGPGGLEEDDNSGIKDDMKNRRKSAFVPAFKGILPSKEDAERKAARRKSMMNRRVSFAPEATLHTWDVIEYMRDHTTSTESSESTRRASNITRSSGTSSSPGASSDAGEEPPSTPPEHAEPLEQSQPSPEHHRDLHQKKLRRSSVVSPADFNNAEDLDSSSMVSGSSDASGSEEDDNDEEASDMEDATATGTAMSLDMGDNTLLSTSESEGSSTSSSARLDQNLRAAATMAGTRGIEYDEFGDESMELAGDDITNAFQPWAQRDSTIPPLQGSALLDQENVNPFSPAFKAEVTAQPVVFPETIDEEGEEGEEGEEDMSMDVTRAVGGILQAKSRAQPEPPLDDGTMDFTQAIGKVHNTIQTQSPNTRSGTKRRRSTTADGSPGALAPGAQAKRRRSSIARSSMGDETMDLTIAMGGVESSGPVVRVDRRRSIAKRRSSGVDSEQGEMTMDFTRPLGGIQASNRRQTAESFDENEELTMELTTVLGGIKAVQNIGSKRPETPRESQSPEKAAAAANTTPKDQERFRDVPDSRPGKLLTPILQKSAEKPSSKSSSKFKNASPSSKPASVKAKPEDTLQMRGFSPFKLDIINLRRGSPLKNELSYPDLSPDAETEAVTPEDRTPLGSPARTPKSELKHPLDAQLLSREQSPLLEKQLRSTPVKPVPSPRKAITPQKAATPQKQMTPKVATPKATTPKALTPKAVTPRAVTPKTATPQEAVAPKAAIPEQPDIQETASPKTVTPKRSTPRKDETPRTATPQLASTPQQSSPQQDSQELKKLADNIKMMSTPRKETLKTMTPKKQTPAAKQQTPLKRITPATKPTPRSRHAVNGSPARQLSDDMLKLRSDDAPKQKIRLQDFLDAASIRFMDLTTTKRRMTTMPTPSKNRKDAGIEEPEVTLESAVVAAACTGPEKELFSHACHELKRYIHEGKGAIKELEAETFRETPPLLQAYMYANSSRKFAIDAQLRDIKTHSRLRSKEMWYGWRGQLLDELMHALQGIAEGLIRDDEILQSKEELLAEVLPGLVEQHIEMQAEAQRLEEAANAVSDEEKEELEAARERIVYVDAELEEKRRMLSELQQDVQQQDTIEENLRDTKLEFTAAIEEAERVRESCRSISLEEINNLGDSIKFIEETYGWTITTASSSPPTITMTYKASLQLYFQPSAFLIPTATFNKPRTNAPISLTYINSTKPLSTTLRFFLQLLRASLQALPQSSTPVPSLLNLVSSGWDTATSVAESERRLFIEGLAETRIVSDERLLVSSFILLPKVRTKVRVSFEVAAAVGEDLTLSETVGVEAKVVYGEKYNEKKMVEAVEGMVGGSVEGWESAVRDLKEKLLVRGAKGLRK